MSLPHSRRPRGIGRSLALGRVRVLGAVPAPALVSVFALLACSNGRSNPLDCTALCPGADQPFEILPGYDEGGVWDPTAPLVMEYGPQGGQHVFLAVRVRVPVEERLRFDFRYLDAESGGEIAQARWQEDPEGCGLLIEKIPLVFREDEPASGHVEMRATTSGCEWELASDEFRVRPPNTDVRDAGPAGGDASDVGTSDVGTSDAGTSDADTSDEAARGADVPDASVEAGR